MKAKEWLRLMQQAADYNPNMTKLIEKYGELLVMEAISEGYVPKEQHDIIVATADRLLLENKKLYPKEFVEYVASLGRPSQSEIEEGTELSLDDLYQWWKENVR